MRYLEFCLCRFLSFVFAPLEGFGSQDFFMGSNLESMWAYEDAGLEYFEGGVPRSAIDSLGDHGVDAVRAIVKMPGYPVDAGGDLATLQLFLNPGESRLYMDDLYIPKSVLPAVKIKHLESGGTMDGRGWGSAGSNCLCVFSERGVFCIHLYLSC